MKNSTNTNTWLLVVIIILLFLCLFKLYINNKEIHIIEALPVNKEESKKSVPANVQAKYEVLREEYASSLGATLEFCTKGNKAMYAVSGSGGFSGVEYYYDKQGNQIESNIWDDVIGDQEPKSSIDKSTYQCSVIESLMKYKSQ